MEPLNVLLFGFGYFPRIVSGDKNFFYRLVPIIAKKLDNLAIVSVNYRNEQEIQQVNGKAIPLYNLKRALHYGDPQRFYSSPDAVFHHHHKHKPGREALERQLTVLASLKRLAAAVRENDIRVIHFMDNCGLAMALAKQLLPRVRVSCSAPNYYRRSRLYELYPRYSLGLLDKVVPYTGVYRDRLQEMGIPADKLQLIRWGVPRQEATLSPQQKALIRRSHGLAQDSILLVWCGFIQQVNEEAFLKALHIARHVVRSSDRTEFIFAFKPLCYKHEYAAKAQDRIKIVSRVDSLLRLLETADFFFSPISDVNSTVSPPLTWLEAMSLGTPVITTEVAGVGELVTHGETGYIADSFDSLPQVVLEAINDGRRDEVSERARHIVSQKYNIEESAEQYAKMWRGMTSGD